jgi:hypothetical protein
MKHITRIGILKKSCKSKQQKIGINLDFQELTQGNSILLPPTLNKVYKLQKRNFL